MAMLMARQTKCLRLIGLGWASLSSRGLTLTLLQIVPTGPAPEVLGNWTEKCRSLGIVPCYVFGDWRFEDNEEGISSEVVCLV